MCKIKTMKKVGVKKYDDIVKQAYKELDEFEQYRFIMLLFNDLMSFLGKCFDSSESEEQYYKLLKAYNIMMEVLEKNEEE